MSDPRVIDRCIAPEGFSELGATRPLVFNVFIVYPKDAEDLARNAKEACSHLTDTCKDNLYALRARRWEDTTYPMVNASVQEQIEEAQGAPNENHIVIVVCDYRLGPKSKQEITKVLNATGRHPALFWMMPETLHEPMTVTGGDENERIFNEWRSCREFMSEVCARGENWFVKTVEAPDREEYAKRVYGETRNSIEAYVRLWVERAFPRSEPFGVAVSAGDAPAASQALAGDVGPVATARSRVQTPVYNGLAPYTTAQADHFFGREDEIVKFSSLLVDEDLQCLHLVGPSGVGKSSLVYAGILPELNKEHSAGPPIPFLTMKPGDDPLISLASSWRSESGFPGASRPPALIAEELRTTGDFLEVLDRMCPLQGETSKRALFVDQLEELLMQSEDDPEIVRERRRRFGGFIVDYVRADPRNLLITTIRADRFHYLLRDEWRKLGELPGRYGHQSLYEPDRWRGLERIVRGPTEKLEWSVEEQLIEALREDIADWSGQDWPAILSLILERMVEQWREDEPRVLSAELYRRVGRLQGAVERLTAYAVADLSAEESALLPSVFSLLVRTDDAGAPAKRVLERHSLDTEDELLKVVEKLCNHRIVREEGGFELSHDVLFREWPMLSTWVAEEREAISDFDDLERRALKWRKSDGSKRELIDDNEALTSAENAVHRLEVRARSNVDIASYLLESRKAVDQRRLVQAILKSSMREIRFLLHNDVRLDHETVRRELVHECFYYALYPDDVPRSGLRSSEFGSRAGGGRQDTSVDGLSDAARQYFDESKLSGLAHNGFRVQHFAALGGSVPLLEALDKLGAEMHLESEKGSTPFQLAAYGGNIEALEWFKNVAFDWKALVNSQNAQGMSALHWAAFSSLGETATWLIGNGADVDAQESNGWTPVLFACQEGAEDVLRALLDAKANISLKTRDGMSSLRIAAACGQPKILEMLLALPEASDLLHEQPEDGFSALMLACGTSNRSVPPIQRLATLQLLLEADASTNVVSSERRLTPLHLLVSAEDATPEHLKLLLAYGAKADAEDSAGDTPLSVALRAESFLKAQALIEHVLENGDDKQRGRALLDATSAGAADFVDLLLERGADLTVTDGRRKTAIHIAAENGERELVELLMKWGSSLTAKTASGATALHVAAARGHEAVVELLVMHTEVDLDQTDNSGDTALMGAARARQVDVCDLLLDKGAGVAQVNRDGQTVLSILLRARASVAAALEKQSEEPEGGDVRSNTLWRRLRSVRREAVSEGLLESLEALGERIFSAGGEATRWSVLQRDERGRLVGLERVSAEEFVSRALPNVNRDPGASWPSAPLAPGIATSPDPDEARALFRALWNQQDTLDGVNIVEIDAVRAIATPFFGENARLIEGRARCGDESLAVLAFVERDGETTLMNGASPPIHMINAKTAPLLNTVENASRYLRFFCAAVHGEEGPFTVLVDPEQIEFVADTPPAVRERVVLLSKPVEMVREEDGDGNWLSHVTIAYSNAVFSATFKVMPTGMIEMLEDTPRAAELSVLVDRFDGPLRTRKLISAKGEPEFAVQSEVAAGDAASLVDGGEDEGAAYGPDSRSLDAALESADAPEEETSEETRDLEPRDFLLSFLGLSPKRAKRRVRSRRSDRGSKSA